MKLWLVRHAKPPVAPGTCYGASDIAADEHATAIVASRLAELLPAGARVLSSPLRRCESLASALRALRPDLEYALDPRLREMDFGSWEGRLWCDIPRDEFDTWMANFAGHAVGGGESVGAFVDRVAQALACTRDVEDTGRDTVWITHAGVIRAATMLVQGTRQVNSPSDWPSTAPGFGEWHELIVEPASASRGSGQGPQPPRWCT